VSLPPENPFESPASAPRAFTRVESIKTVFPNAVGLVVVGNLCLCILAPAAGLLLGFLVSVPGLVNGYANLQRKLRYETAHWAEQWFCIVLGFVQLLPLGFLAGIAMMVVGSLLAVWIDSSSKHDTAIDEVIEGLFGGLIAALFVYFGGLFAMVRWKRNN